MYSPVAIFLFIVFAISLVCSVYVTYILCRARKNYIVAILSFSFSLVSIDVLPSIFWGGHLERAPRGFCYYQGLMLQYACYLTMACALCFATQTYRLLVLYKQETSKSLERLYYGFIIIYPLLMTLILAIFSIRFDAIEPRLMNCDVVSTPIRLIGYSGTNFILTIPGTYISARAAYSVYMHLDQFKTTLSKGTRELKTGELSEEMGTASGSQEQVHEPSFAAQGHDQPESVVVNMKPSQSHSFNNTNVQPHPPPFNPNPVSYSKIADNSRSYNITRRAAIRMVGFSLAFIFINFTASIQVISKVISNEPNEVGLAPNDWVGGLLGIIVYLVFGLPNSIFRVQNI